MFIGDSTARQIHHLLLQHLANRPFSGGGSHSTQEETVVSFPFAAVTSSQLGAGGGTSIPQGAPVANGLASHGAESVECNRHGASSCGDSNLTQGMPPPPAVASAASASSEPVWTEAFSARFVYHWAPIIEGLAHSIRYDRAGWGSTGEATRYDAFSAVGIGFQV